MDAIHVEIRGRVQGVGFRWFIQEIARRLDLSGWVSNRADGVVEVAAAGDPHALEKFTAEVRKGPPGAIVEEVRTVSPIDPTSLSKPFAIARVDR